MHSLEVLESPVVPKHGLAILRAVGQVAEARGFSVEYTKGYRGKCDCIMVYGAGKGNHRVSARKYVRKGKHAIIWDIGYWDRTEPESYRLSIDDPHPTPKLVARLPTWGRAYPFFDSVADPEGFILLCSALPKSATKENGKAGDLFEQVREIKKYYPLVQVHYRPKYGRPSLLEGFQGAPGSIGEAMRGSRLVVTQTSNVGVDAVIYGVPCVVTGGVAASFWPMRIGTIFSPTEQERRDFLNKVAWLNWKVTKADQAFEMIGQLCGF